MEQPSLPVPGVLDVSFPMGRFKPSGAAGEPLTGRKPMAAPPELRVKLPSCTRVFSTEATASTFSPRAGAPTLYGPVCPLSPAAALTTTPALTSRLAARAVGYCGHWNGTPRLMFSTCMPSAWARSIAVSSVALSVGP